ncbi:hypothetical protein B0T40_15055 [Chromobacterium haemolyticum]|uniref:TRAFAC clade GTPase domain-containing protein n=1 Tax=Chromobacterium haemolyticum TaxID=394935 RepID=UPI0009DA2C28|nr:hypothetical protein [Chromobacterium haemolyticum]OQS34640.1 hypothetical protein B0T40_15055 [Chromobacterium haemolyticum]
MAENDGFEVSCGNPDCRIAETGRCVEGFQVNACPHYGRELEKAAEDNTDDDEGAGSSTSVVLPGADTLTPIEASRLLRAGDARVIAVIGSSDAGKTSLIASLYDLFQEGPLSGINYSRSQTLHAFEHTCHDARAASRRDVPHMNRTPLGEVRFYHLELGGGRAGERVALILGDRAGEEYRTAANDASVVMAFSEVRRADSLTALVDGQRLLDAGARHNLRSEITMILQAFVDSGAVQVGQRLALVLTKIDLVQESPHRARAEADFDTLATNIRRIFSKEFPVIEQFRVAASPRTELVSRGTGVPELLNFWLEQACPATIPPIARPLFSRAFARVVPLDA